MCFWRKSKIIKKNKKSNIKTLAEQEFNQGPLAPKADALPLHHLIN